MLCGKNFFSARHYLVGNADVARFLSLDPLAAKYPGLSDYCYVAGNPLVFVDPDGRSPNDIYYDNKTGEVLGEEKGDSETINHRLISREDYEKAQSNEEKQASSKVIKSKIKGADLEKLMDKSHPEKPPGKGRKEHGALIILDLKKAEISLAVQSPKGNTHKKTTFSMGKKINGRIFKDGQYQTLLVIGTYHTHPNPPKETIDGRTNTYGQSPASNPHDEEVSLKDGIPYFYMNLSNLDVVMPSNANSIDNHKTTQEVYNGTYNLGFDALRLYNQQ